MIKGIALSILASTFFGIQYFYATIIEKTSMVDIFIWRIFFCFIFITLYILLLGGRGEVYLLANRIKRQPALTIGLFFSSFLLVFQQWLFIWAPLNGRALNVSLGYFLLPISMILVGKFLYKEEINNFQKIASFFAMFGVFHEIYMLGSLPLESLAVAIGFTLYFVLRKHLDINNIAGLWCDFLFFIPFIIVFIWYKGLFYDYIEFDVFLTFELIFFGFISALAFMAYIASSKKLPFVVFGLLGYLEPVLLVFVSLLIGEKISNDKLLTYIPIWFSLLFLFLDGFLNLIRKKINFS